MYSAVSLEYRAENITQDIRTDTTAIRNMSYWHWTNHYMYLSHSWHQAK